MAPDAARSHSSGVRPSGLDLRAEACCGHAERRDAASYRARTTALGRGGPRWCRLRQLDEPTPAPAPAVCTFTITIGMFPIAPPTPGQGMVWTTYFAATILPSQATVYVVDVNAAPSGCLTSWTAVSANTSAVQLSPAGGSGRGQVELFMPANLGAQRSTDVTIAGQRATIMQAGR
jgi:hypothetical protein